ncbi:hypothetical protein SynWH8103_02910 [Synechococcus sp. WH 8103]|nr:hypothetical protein SynWH8103_02910 [Synechococcus sp. WH 8103]
MKKTLGMIVLERSDSAKTLMNTDDQQPLLNDSMENQL